MLAKLRRAGRQAFHWTLPSWAVVQGWHSRCFALDLDSLISLLQRLPSLPCHLFLPAPSRPGLLPGAGEWQVAVQKRSQPFIVIHSYSPMPVRPTGIWNGMWFLYPRVWGKGSVSKGRIWGVSFWSTLSFKWKCEREEVIGPRTKGWMLSSPSSYTWRVWDSILWRKRYHKLSVAHFPRIWVMKDSGETIKTHMWWGCKARWKILFLKLFIEVRFIYRKTHKCISNLMYCHILNPLM